MKLKVDRQADAIYLTLVESAVIESVEVAPDIIVDYNDQKQVVGIEMLHLSKLAPELDTGCLIFETIPVATVELTKYKQVIEYFKIRDAPLFWYNLLMEKGLQAVVDYATVMEKEIKLHSSHEAELPTHS